jgi:hypothetical protein
VLQFDITFQRDATLQQFVDAVEAVGQAGTAGARSRQCFRNRRLRTQLCRQALQVCNQPGAASGALAQRLRLRFSDAQIAAQGMFDVRERLHHRGSAFLKPVVFIAQRGKAVSLRFGGA